MESSKSIHIPTQASKIVKLPIFPIKLNSLRISNVREQFQKFLYFTFLYHCGQVIKNRILAFPRTIQLGLQRCP